MITKAKGNMPLPTEQSVRIKTLEELILKSLSSILCSFKLKTLKGSMFVVVSFSVFWFVYEVVVVVFLISKDKKNVMCFYLKKTVL